MAETVPIAEQIAEVKRELALREQVYPGFVERKRMEQSEADEHIRRMKGVLNTLLWLHKNEAAIKAVARSASP